MMPANAEGKYTQDDQVVIYYYRKLPFNIGVEKSVKEIILNGENTVNKEGKKLAKVEIKSTDVETAEVIVKYKIVVKNTEKVAGSAEVIDNMPEGLEVASNNPSYWRKMANGMLSTTVELEAGEEKELEVVARWKKGNNNLGTLINAVGITKMENEPGYEDNYERDNTSKAEIIIGIKTGQDIRLVIWVSCIVVTCGVLTYLLIDRYKTQH